MSASPLTEPLVRAALLEIWGEQACQRAADWPQVQHRLMQKTGDRGSMKDAVDEAVAALVAAFANGPPAAPLDAVRRAFSSSTRSTAPCSPSDSQISRARIDCDGARGTARAIPSADRGGATNTRPGPHHRPR
jgi:hypothetical protein